MKSDYKVGFVLSGGGARGIAHLGVVKALAEMGIKPEIISGTSSGAILGAFLAGGFTPDRIMEFIKEQKIMSSLRFAMSRAGLFKMDNAIKLYAGYLGHDTFEKLNIPLIVSATDLITGKSVYFSKGELFKPVMASSAIPVLFKPVIYEGMSLVDGGLLNNLPAEPLQDKCDFVIGIHCNPIGRQDKPGNFRRVMERTFLFTVYNTIRPRIELCDLFIEPKELTRYRVFDVSKSDQIFQAGYEAVFKMKNEIEHFKKLADL
jgi:NTE family protein